MKKQGYYERVAKYERDREKVLGSYMVEKKAQEEFEDVKADPEVLEALLEELEVRLVQRKQELRQGEEKLLEEGTWLLPGYTPVGPKELISSSYYGLALIHNFKDAKKAGEIPGVLKLFQQDIDMGGSAKTADGDGSGGQEQLEKSIAMMEETGPGHTTLNAGYKAIDAEDEVEE